MFTGPAAERTRELGAGAGPLGYGEIGGGRSGLSQGGTGLALWDWEVIVLVVCSVPDEPIQPIDPAAWVSHSAALTGTFPAYPGSSSMSTITSGSSLPDGEPPGPPPFTPPLKASQQCYDPPISWD